MNKLEFLMREEQRRIEETKKRIQEAPFSGLTHVQVSLKDISQKEANK